MLINEDDYYKLGSVGIDCEKILFLMQNKYDDFFKAIESIDTYREANSKYFNISNVYYK